MPTLQGVQLLRCRTRALARRGCRLRTERGEAAPCRRLLLGREAATAAAALAVVPRLTGKVHSWTHH